jgi:hypothetical protein
MSKVKFTAVNSANVSVSNSVDTDKVYDITANVTIMNGKKLSNVDNGIVKKNDKIVCSFTKYGEASLNTSFQNLTDVMEMCSVLQALSAFLSDVEAAVENNNLFNA